eukprot:gene5845-7274_t
MSESGCISYEASVLLPTHSKLGEGALWSVEDQLLYWIDIEGELLHIYNPKTPRDISYKLPSKPGTVVRRKNGHVVLALMNEGVVDFDPHTEQITKLVHPQNVPGNRYNDGKVDPKGRFWVGSMSLSDSHPPVAHLYMIDSNLHSTTKLEQVRISNGIVWNADSTKMYYIDTETHNVDSFDYDAQTGNISNRKIITTIPQQEGYPDGMCIDDEGMIWVAHWAGGKVTRWNPNTGEKLMAIRTPGVTRTTSCAFGGPDLTTMYITTAKGDNEPNSGNLFVYHFTNGIKGVPSFNFEA